MLTQDQRQKFFEAISPIEGFDPAIDALEDYDEQITETRDTIADFIAAQGEPEGRHNDTGLEILEWQDTKRRCRSQEFYVADFGDVRAVWIRE